MGGRPKKAAVNSVVWINNPRHGVPRFGVVVAYRGKAKTNRYVVVDSDSRGAHRGYAVNLNSEEFVPVGIKSIVAGRIYRKNEAEGGTLMRDCGCHCCHHINGMEPEPEE